eukprot:Platyproteum_vivax@DN14244_c0_g1_i1.p1
MLCMLLVGVPGNEEYEEVELGTAGKQKGFYIDQPLIEENTYEALHIREQVQPDLSAQRALTIQPGTKLLQPAPQGEEIYATMATDKDGTLQQRIAERNIWTSPGKPILVDGWTLQTDESGVDWYYSKADKDELGYPLEDYLEYSRLVPLDPDCLIYENWRPYFTNEFFLFYTPAYRSGNSPKPYFSLRDFLIRNNSNKYKKDKPLWDVLKSDILNGEWANHDDVYSQSVLVIDQKDIRHVLPHSMYQTLRGDAFAIKGLNLPTPPTPPTSNQENPYEKLDPRQIVPPRPNLQAKRASHEPHPSESMVNLADVKLKSRSMQPGTSMSIDQLIETRKQQKAATLESNKPAWMRQNSGGTNKGGPLTPPKPSVAAKPKPPGTVAKQESVDRPVPARKPAPPPKPDPPTKRLTQYTSKAQNQ